jgi:hypothetical protein
LLEGDGQTWESSRDLPSSRVHGNHVVSELQGGEG